MTSFSILLSFLFISINSLLLVFGESSTCNFQYPGYVPPPGSNQSYYLPDHWGECPNSVCESGLNQSPIPLNSSTAVLKSDLGYIDFEWKKTQNVTLSWTGISQQYSTNTVPQTHPSFIKQSSLPSGDKFVLKEIHLHQPSEHTIDGKYYDVEAHFVHQNEAGTVAVVGFMFEEGGENSYSEFFETVLNEKPSAIDPQDILILASLYPGLVLSEFQSRSYYHYMGSFTIPPCTEGVYWFVMQDPIQVSASQLELLKSIQTENNRPLQDLHNRTVYSFLEGPEEFCSKVGSNCSACQDGCKKACNNTCQKYGGDCKKVCKDQCSQFLCKEVC